MSTSDYAKRRAEEKRIDAECMKQISDLYVKQNAFIRNIDHYQEIIDDDIIWYYFDNYQKYIMAAFQRMRDYEEHDPNDIAFKPNTIGEKLVYAYYNRKYCSKKDDFYFSKAISDVCLEYNIREYDEIICKLYGRISEIKLERSIIEYVYHHKKDITRKQLLDYIISLYKTDEDTNKEYLYKCVQDLNKLYIRYFTKYGHGEKLLVRLLLNTIINDVKDRLGEYGKYFVYSDPDKTGLFSRKACEVNDIYHVLFLKEFPLLFEQYDGDTTDNSPWLVIDEVNGKVYYKDIP